MNPIVSVIIPTYNRRFFLKEAVESVLQQDYTLYELIVVDDGSTDGTQAAISEYPSVTCVRQKNSGPAAARNRGVSLARGKLIAFLDSDDLWLPQKLSTQVALMENDPQVLVTYTDEIWIRNGVRVNPRKKHKKYSGWIFASCLPLCIISPSSVMIHRNIFNQVGAFDEALPVCEDYDLWLRIAARLPVSFIEQKLIIKRGGHADQLSRRYWGNDRFRIQALEKIIADQTVSHRNRALAIEELIRKSSVLEQGFRKRGKWREADHYQQLIKEYRP